MLLKRSPTLVKIHCSWSFSVRVSTELVVIKIKIGRFRTRRALSSIASVRISNRIIKMVIALINVRIKWSTTAFAASCIRRIRSQCYIGLFMMAFDNTLWNIRLISDHPPTPATSSLLIVPYQSCRVHQHTN